MKLIYGILFSLFSFLIVANQALAFTCLDANGNTLNSNVGTKTANAYVTLTPQIGTSQNLVVDISSSISCRNDNATGRNDLVSLYQGSTFNGALANFDGSLSYFSSTYAFPLNTETKTHNYTSGSYVPLQAILYLTPISSAGGVVIAAGTKFASISIHQHGSNISDGGEQTDIYFVWNLYSTNDVVVPTGGCDVSSRDVTVDLPNYPGTASVPLTVHCAKSQSLAFYLTGTTASGSSNTTFTNVASSSSAATGVGIQLFRSGSAVPTNSNVSLGSVGTSAVDLGLKAHYARTTGQVTAGTVQSVIGVTFVYQ